MTKQITNTVLMIRPTCFDLNEETAKSNAFQQQRTETPAQIMQKALEEFDAFVATLQQKGIAVLVFQDELIPPAPDSIFPNNWVTFHEDAKAILYPMAHPSRQRERRLDILEKLQYQYAFNLQNTIDFATENETNNSFLEGTGSMILDRVNKIVYACISPRTNANLLQKWCKIYNYKSVIFGAYDPSQQAIYHTNVIMVLGETFAIICLDSIFDVAERQNVVAVLQSTKHKIIDISFAQMKQFAGNMLQLSNNKNERILVMSAAAYSSLSGQQLEKLQSHNEHIIKPAIPTIEKYGGGGVRCMLAEVFLPKV